MRSQVILTVVLSAMLASCGTIPPGEITLNYRSGVVRDVRLLTVDTSEVVVRDSFGTAMHVPVDSLSFIVRPNPPNIFTMILGGIVGAGAGFGASVLLVNATESTTIEGDVVTIAPPVGVLYIGVPITIATFTSLGIWGGSMLHPGKNIHLTEPDAISQLREIAIFPNGLPARENK
jgi:hypothetical protein